MTDPRPYSKKELKKLFTNLARKGTTDDMFNVLIETLWRNKYTMRTSGFVNAGGPDAVISFNNATREFTITPLNPEVETYIPRFSFFTYNYSAEFHQRFEPEILKLPNEEGLYVIYYDTEELERVHKLFYTKNPTELRLQSIYYDKVIVAFIYYDAVANEPLHFGDSRHGSEWQPQMHLYLHTAFNARRKNGLTLTGATMGGDGSQDAHAKFSVSGGTMLHDDFEMDFESSTESLPILYRYGALPRFHNKTGYAMYALSGLVCYNDDAGAVIPATDNYFVLYHIFAVNEIAIAARKIISVMGKAEYETLSEAYAAADSEIDFAKSWMPQQGRLHIGTIVVQTSENYTNAIKARIVGVINESHPPVSIAENSKKLLEIDPKQELSIPGDFEEDQFYAIKNRIWQKITGGGGGGDDGRTPQLREEAGWVEWKYTDEATWNQLFEIPADGDDGITPHIGANGNWYFGATDTGIPATGDPGQDAFTYVAYASTNTGTGWSLTPTDSLKYRAEIHPTTAKTPVEADFAAAEWVKYIGDDGGGGSGGSEPPELHLDFEEAGDEFIYNVPYNMKFTSQVSEHADATMNIALGTDMPRYTKFKVTATAGGEVSFYGEYI